MGYYIRKGLVKENEEFLDEILSQIKQGSTINYPCDHPSQVPKVRNYINKLLRACTILTDECNGRFAILRSLVTVSEDFAAPAVVLVPKVGADRYMPVATINKVMHPDEHEALRQIRRSDKDTITLKFTPSDEYPGDDWLTDECAKAGFSLSIMEFGEDDGPLAGTKSYVVTRTQHEARGAFSILERYSKPGAPRS
jgi:hypothetical protein